MAGIMIAFGIMALLVYRYESKTLKVNSDLPVEQLVIETREGVRHNFNVEIAATPMNIQVGLMYRKSMPKDEGMLFQLGGEPREISFWMKNTLIPLDIIFVAKDGTIVKIHEMTEPKSLTSRPSGSPVTGAVELNGGTAQKLGIRSGDKVIHPYFQGQ